MSHLFITRGNLAHLACDAWLLSTGPEVYVAHSWQTSLNEEEWRLAEDAHGGARGRLDGSSRVMPLAPSPGMARTRAWLTNVGGTPASPPEWYVDGVLEFLDTVEEWLTHQPAAVNGRERPLVCVDAVGTGYGGMAGAKGPVVRALIERLADEAKVRPFDIALVAFDDRMLAAAQQIRAEVSDSSAWLELPPYVRKAARRLAKHASEGELVLFLGAGVSAGAGLPTWHELLRGLAADAGFASSDQSALGSMPAVDQAHVLAARLQDRGLRIGEAVARRVKTAKYSLAHSLLATLPVGEVATTNYDRLFEDASKDAGHELSVLPYEPSAGRQRWLLKMHGCVDHPEDIVLTRSDYLRYAERRAALAGIVQALLITRHMLFVGFSLSDDNFHRIADEVRRALEPGIKDAQDTRERRAFGTSLILGPDPFLEELWRPEIECVAVGDGADDAHLTASARQLDIFLDYLCALTTERTAHLMDPTFDDVLSAGERELRDQLGQLPMSLSDEARATAAWRSIEGVLERFGQPPGPDETIRRR